METLILYLVMAMIKMLIVVFIAGILKSFFPKIFSFLGKSVSYVFRIGEDFQRTIKKAFGKE